VSIYEYRRYDILPGRMPAIKARFEKVAMRYWDKHGIRCLGFWETVFGESNQLHYLLEWNDMGQRELLWDQFQADPGWQQERADSEKNGPLVQHVHNEFWRLSPFSPRPTAASGR
jgi:hypothetical protein